MKSNNISHFCKNTGEHIRVSRFNDILSICNGFPDDVAFQSRVVMQNIGFIVVCALSRCDCLIHMGAKACDNTTKFIILLNGYRQGDARKYTVCVSVFQYLIVDFWSISFASIRVY